MPKLSDSQTEFLQRMVDSGHAASVQDALDIAFDALDPEVGDARESEASIAEGKRRARLAAQGVGVRSFDSPEAFLGEIQGRALAGKQR